MRLRPLGSTGMKVSELALGTWGLAGDGYSPVPEAEQDKVIERARALGITLFDTADSYAHGAMERRLGERLPEDGRTRIVTKIGTFRYGAPPRKRFERAYLLEAFERSRERLRRNTLDIVLLHNPSLSAIEKGEATALLSELEQKKELRAWGASIATAEIGRAAITRGARVLAIAYNAFHSNEFSMLEEDVKKSEIALFAHSVLAYGLLCGHWPLDKEFPAGDHRAERWTSDELRRRIRQLDAVRPLVGGQVLTMRAGALRYVLSSPLVSSAILGPRSSLQLDQLVREAGKSPPYLTEQALTALSARLRQVGANP